MTIRKSMAHMQYGNFFSQENGTLILYWLYNKDDGIRKDSGIVFEFVLHELIQRFFNKAPLLQMGGNHSLIYYV